MRGPGEAKAKRCRCLVDKRGERGRARAGENEVGKLDKGKSMLAYRKGRGS